MKWFSRRPTPVKPKIVFELSPENIYAELHGKRPLLTRVEKVNHTFCPPSPTDDKQFPVTFGKPLCESTYKTPKPLPQFAFPGE